MKDMQLISELMMKEMLFKRSSEIEAKRSEKERELAKLALIDGNKTFATYHINNHCKHMEFAQKLLRYSAQLTILISELNSNKVDEEILCSITKTIKKMDTQLKNSSGKKLEKCIAELDLIKSRPSSSYPQNHIDEHRISAIMDDLQNEILMDTSYFDFVKHDGMSIGNCDTTLGKTKI